MDWEVRTRWNFAKLHKAKQNFQITCSHELQELKTAYW